MKGKKRTGYLRIKVWSAFTISEKNKTPRWGGSVSADNVVAHAIPRLYKGDRSLNRAGPETDIFRGESTIDIRGILRNVKIRLEPPMVALGDQPAGPLLDPPGFAPRADDTKEKEAHRKDLEKKFGVMMRRRYPPLELDVHVLDGFVQSDPDLRPRVVKGMTHGRVMSYGKDFIEIDWKPDWVSAGPPDVFEYRKNRNVLDLRIDGWLQNASAMFDVDQGVIVIHRTDTNTIGSALNTFIKGDANIHYVVDVDGHVVKMLDDKAQYARHAGEGAQWEGNLSVNFFAIGIELVNNGGAFPKAQMDSLINLVDMLKKIHGISPHRVLAHCEISPLVGKQDVVSLERAECPGFDFDWIELEKKGLATSPLFGPNARLPIGFEEFFVRDVESMDDALRVGNKDENGGRYGKKNRKVTRNDLVRQLQKNLYELGYENVPKDEPGEFGEFTMRLVQRFQGRYFTGKRARYLGEGRTFDGKANLSTVVAMQAVLAAKGKEWRYP
jgi:N-acetyl-anhydromuramyl-L-alanine amidase AmpD